MQQETSIAADRSIQNPRSLAPQELFSALRVIPVTYRGFDELLHKGHIVMHADVVSDVQSFFDLALALDFPLHSVIPISDPRYAWDDEASCAANNSSGFNYRTITANPDKLSKHAYGAAFDINPVQNIYVKYDEQLQIVFTAPAHGVYDEHSAGTLSREHALVQHMKKLGWTWGGDWTPESGRTDYQHFEKDILR